MTPADALGSDAAIGAKDAAPREPARLLLQYEPKKVAAVRQVRVDQETKSSSVHQRALIVLYLKARALALPAIKFQGASSRSR